MTMKIPVGELIWIARGLQHPEQAQGRVVWDFVPEGADSQLPQRVTFEVEGEAGAKRWVIWV